MVSHGFHGFHGLFHRCDRPCRADSVGWLYGDDVTLCHPNRVSLACEASTETMKTMETIRDGAGTRRRGERGAIPADQQPQRRRVGDRSLAIPFRDEAPAPAVAAGPDFSAGPDFVVSFLRRWWSLRVPHRFEHQVSGDPAGP